MKTQQQPPQLRTNKNNATNPSRVATVWRLVDRRICTGGSVIPAADISRFDVRSSADDPFFPNRQNFDRRNSKGKTPW
jgi:hypothetical protein